MKKYLLILFSVICLCLFASCGDNIDGKWELTETRRSDGEVVKADETKGYTYYEISGETGKYVVKTPALDKTYDVTFKKSGDKYIISMEGLDLWEATVSGSKMSYTASLGELTEEYIYEKK